MKRITFAVPCYNSSAYMKKCIDSLLIAGEDAEIIIVNDGSNKDNTAEIADNYQKDYPSIIKVIHKENGGHGDAVTVGIKNATGKYFKVVDSDDWLEENALKKLMEFLNSLDDENSPDTIICNYVYEHVNENKQRFVNYKKEFPINRIFSFEESKPFAVGKYIAMHSLIYKTSILHEIDLTLPKHTFYVDNVFIVKPLMVVKTFYYLDLDLYRYFIGRESQSVNESVIMKNIDQHIRMTKVLINDCDLDLIKDKHPKRYEYLLNHFAILFTINSIYLIKIGTEESERKRLEFWEELKEKAPNTYRRIRKKFVGITASKSKLVCCFSKIGYTIARKIFKFN